MVQIGHWNGYLLLRAILATGVVTTSSPAQEQPSAHADTLLLEWTAPAECPSGGAVEARVRALVQSVPSQPFTARIHIEQVSNRWVAILDAQQGERRLEGTTCLEVADTISLVLALALDPTAASRADTNQNGANQHSASQQGTDLAHAETDWDAKGPEPVIEDAHANRAVAPPVMSSLPPRQVPSPKRHTETRAASASSNHQTPSDGSSRDQGRSSRDLSFGAGISIIGEVGALPNISYAGGGRVRLAGNAWAIALGYSYYPTQTATVHGSDAGGRILLKYGFIEPCLATQLVEEHAGKREPHELTPNRVETQLA